MQNLDLVNESRESFISIRDWISTEDLAKQAATTPGTIRVRLCKFGSYFGIRPQKLPNGRLLWPADSLNRLFEKADKGGAQ